MPRIDDSGAVNYSAGVQKQSNEGMLRSLGRGGLGALRWTARTLFQLADGIVVGTGKTLEKSVGRVARDIGRAVESDLVAEADYRVGELENRFTHIVNRDCNARERRYLEAIGMGSRGLVEKRLKEKRCKMLRGLDALVDIRTESDGKVVAEKIRKEELEKIDRDIEAERPNRLLLAIEEEPEKVKAWLREEINRKFDQEEERFLAHLLDEIEDLVAAAGEPRRKEIEQDYASFREEVLKQIRNSKRNTLAYHFNDDENSYRNLIKAEYNRLFSVELSFGLKNLKAEVMPEINRKVDRELDQEIKKIKQEVSANYNKRSQEVYQKYQKLHADREALGFASEKEEAEFNEELMEKTQNEMKTLQEEKSFFMEKLLSEARTKAKARKKAIFKKKRAEYIDEMRKRSLANANSDKRLTEPRPSLNKRFRAELRLKFDRERKEKLEHGHVWPKLSRAVSAFIPSFLENELLPGSDEAAGAALAGLAEYQIKWLYSFKGIIPISGPLYQLGKSLALKYDREHQISAKMMQSPEGKATIEAKRKACANLYHLATHNSSVAALVNTQEILLRVGEGVDDLLGRIKMPRVTGLVATELGNVFRHAKAGEEYVEEQCRKLKPSASKAEAYRLSLRLDYCREHGMELPGFPKGKAKSVAEFNQQCDAAMKKYIDEMVEEILELVVPEDYQEWSGAMSVAYNTQGKDIIRNILTHLISQSGVNQFSDPNQIRLVALRVMGVDTTDLEQDGFGMGQKGSVEELGSKIIRKILDPKRGNSISSALRRSSLQEGQGIIQSVEQEHETERLLEETVSNKLHKLFKEDTLGSSPRVKQFRNWMRNIPVIGFVVRGVDRLINTIKFAVTYPFYAKKGDTFMGWMMRNLAGKGLTDGIAKNCVALADDPWLRIANMQALVALRKHINEVGEQMKKGVKQSAEEKVSSEEAAPFNQYQSSFGDIGYYFVDRVIPNWVATAAGWSEKDIKKKIGAEAARALNSQLNVPFKPMGEMAIEMAVPTLREMSLTYRLISYFRRTAGVNSAELNKKQTKLWEVYLRGYLNKRVAQECANRHIPLRSEAAGILRQRLVERFMAMPEEDFLREMVSISS